jgi:hypothetical protein
VLVVELEPFDGAMAVVTGDSSIVDVVNCALIVEFGLPDLVTDGSLDEVVEIIVEEVEDAMDVLEVTVDVTMESIVDEVMGLLLVVVDVIVDVDAKVVFVDTPSAVPGTATQSTV